MIDLLKSASQALIANDATALERLALDASSQAGCSLLSGSINAPAELGCAVDVLRRQVQAASSQLAVRRRLYAAAGMQVHPWER